MNGWTTIAVTMPDKLAAAMLWAAEHTGERTGPRAIRLGQFIMVSRKALEGLSNGLRGASEQHCGGAATSPERGCELTRSGGLSPETASAS